MSSVNTDTKVTLAAHYHLPGTYSCRAPMSSMAVCSALPAPCPSTVRLALVRVGIEHFGVEGTREVLFPIIRSMRIAIRPPERVAFIAQRLRLYKAGGDRHDVSLEESIGYREFVHAQGPMTVYIEVPAIHEDTFRELLSGIGYWGQGNSLSQCLTIEQLAPVKEECALPLREVASRQRLQSFVTSLASDFRGADVLWSEIMPNLLENKNDIIQIELYVWPMVVIGYHDEYRLLLRRSIF